MSNLYSHPMRSHRLGRKRNHAVASSVYRDRLRCRVGNLNLQRLLSLPAIARVRLPTRSLHLAELCFLLLLYSSRSKSISTDPTDIRDLIQSCTVVLNHTHHQQQRSSRTANSSGNPTSTSLKHGAPSSPLTPPSQTSHRFPRIQVSSLLSNPQGRHYFLEVIQHPIRTAEFGGASLSRLPLTPPLVAQLIVRDSSGRPVNDDLDIPFLVAHASLYNSDGQPLDMASDPNGSDPTPHRLLYGTLVATPQVLVDLQGNAGIFFLFTDISVRWRGRYQLGVTLVRLSQTDPSGVVTISDRGTVLAEARTQPFDVVRHQEYSASPPTRLMQAFIRQGARMNTSMSGSRIY